MKLYIEKNILQDMIIQMKHFLKNKNYSSSFSNLLLLICDDNYLSIEINNLKTGISIFTHDTTIIQTGSVAIKWKKLLNIVKQLEDKPIMLKTEENYLRIEQKELKFKLPMHSILEQLSTSTDINDTFNTNLSKQSTTKNELSSTILNTSFTFENFIVGTSNQLAFAAAKSVAKKPGKQYNPLFIYGGSGLGKTHLVQAIGNYAITQDKTVIYTTSEQFLNDFLYNLRNYTMDRFRQKYRECDFLLIDDIQFLINKEQTQEEFSHAFNELYNLKKQIVLTSDKPPKKIAGLEDRLKTRFEWGLIANVQPPEFETKISIIKKKCELDNIYLNDKVIHYIASHLKNNIREIESTITSLNAHANLLSKQITLDFTKDSIKDLINL